MARYTGPVCRLCRREGCKLFLKGERCNQDDKCALGRTGAKGVRPAPGMHKNVRKKESSYANQLREKQKTKRIYGLGEKQFHKYYEMAERMRGATGENMLILIERRLDNVIYKMGIADSRAQARQLVTHGHFVVNGKKVNIPSYLTKAGDEIMVKAEKQDIPYFKELKAAKIENMAAWVDFDAEKLTGHVKALPTRQDINMDIAEHKIVELYSK